jgi:3-deoxy-7-phosphoheptulonate synthase
MPDSPLSNVHVARFDPLESPDAIRLRIPATTEAEATVARAREEIRRALAGDDRRLVVVIGPCSIHDPEAARDYAARLASLRRRVSDRLLIVMRVYFEKPRTNLGWKGLINDPHLDESFDVQSGLRLARRLLVEINRLGLPCATEFLDPIIPQYTSDLVSWAAIGARTTESQTHRELASGLSMPVGFKNATDGGIEAAVDAMTAALHPHAFLGIDQHGCASVVRTIGNPDVHLVLRGGAGRPNFSRAHLAFARVLIERFGPGPRILVDCAHGNSAKDHARQPAVFRSVLEQLLEGETSILGMMLESNIVEGRQGLSGALVYGQSITDACIGWEATEELILRAHGDLA